MTGFGKTCHLHTKIPKYLEELNYTIQSIISQAKSCRLTICHITIAIQGL